MSDASTVNTLLVALVPVLGGVILALVAGIGWLIKHERERREEIENQVSEKKYKAYMTLIDIFWDVIKTSNTASAPPDNIVSRMIDANKELLIFGTDEVYLDWQTWTSEARKGDAAVMLHGFANIILVIRRDMGNPKTKLTTGNVLRGFIADYDKLHEEGKI